MMEPIFSQSQFRSEGWIQWPDNEDLSIEFMRLLGSAQEGGATVSECFLTASRIDARDADSWHREWKKIADASSERGDAALNNANVLTARSNWLRSANYHQASMLNIDPVDRRAQVARASIQSCIRKYVGQLPCAETVEIPWVEDYPLEGYFLRAGDRAPVVICIGEPGHRKEEYLYKTARYAHDRGMSLLAVDLWGPGGGSDFENIAGRCDLETAICSVMDFLTTRDDVDEGKVAIVGDVGSSFVARGVALDQRFAAAVCDGGIWDMHERHFLMGRLAQNSGVAGQNSYSGIVRQLRCPVLVTVGEHGWLEADQVTELFEQVRGNHPDISLKFFRASETAASQGHSDNPTLANEFIFDWLAHRFEKLG
jgi:pimeloyl-ACP methyl ester carboxylesterase